MTKISSPFPYHGGKYYLADWIISKFPPHIHYVEPYFGGGSVLLRKPVEWVEHHSEVVNDIHRYLTNFWRVLQNESMFRRFQRIIEAVPLSKIEHEDAFAKYDSPDPVQRAVGYFIRMRQSRQGIERNTFITMVTSRVRNGGQEKMTCWWSSIEGLEAVRERLKRVVIYGEDALDIIRQHDTPHTFFYLDPPYVSSSRTAGGEYQYEYTSKDHLKLLWYLGKDLKGKFLLSGYWSKMYEEAARAYGWRQHRKLVTKHSMASNQVKDRVTEYLWCNY